MRLLHTADWHLGHHLHGYERSHEQACFLDWLIGLIHERQIDGLLIVPCATDPAIYLKWARRLPLFLVDRRIDHPALPHVITDAEAAVAELVGNALATLGDEIYYFGGQIGRAHV